MLLSEQAAVTKFHSTIVEALEKLLSVKITARSIKRNCLEVSLPDANSCSCSAFYNRIEALCKKYDLGTVEPGGFARLVIRTSSGNS